MMPTMTREQFEEMSLEELADWAYENIDYVHHEDTLIEMAKHEIDEENLNVAIHILTGIYESEEACNGYYIYDRCMGTLEDVTPITCKEDLEDYIDFGDDAEEAIIDILEQTRDVLLMCLKYMSEDDVKEMCKANEIDLNTGDEEDE